MWIGIKIKNSDRHQNDAGPQHWPTHGHLVSGYVLAAKESEWAAFLLHLQLKVQLRNVAFYIQKGTSIILV
jgi:hypothetical protein